MVSVVKLDIWQAVEIDQRVCWGGRIACSFNWIVACLLKTCQKVVELQFTCHITQSK